MIICAAFNRLKQSQAISVLASVQQERLIIAKATPFQVSQNAVMIADNPYTQPRDILFQTQDFFDAFCAYQHLSASEKLMLHQDLNRYKPENALEVVGMQESGKEKYNIDKLHNGHWAVLAICWYFQRYLQQQHALQGMDWLLAQEEQTSDFFCTI